MRVLATSVGLLMALWIGPAAAHGCHHGWQHSKVEGWHSHGLKCDTRQGLGVSRRSKPHGRRAA
ncbi:protein of unknown function; putative exported protein [Methylorubrum extorquens DM4]|uniref:Uncharacterized protein n=1 Tax=Methylorubrum extorquens (strain DSM 6343 / CIP 106787 / DM4) TaxID=661410 RepID=C7CF16_METED|nr:protein of unknown function; putative exported protein [Methylorubrum extorquens DM4]